MRIGESNGLGMGNFNDAWKPNQAERQFAYFAVGVDGFEGDCLPAMVVLVVKCAARLNDNGTRCIGGVKNGGDRCLRYES